MRSLCPVGGSPNERTDDKLLLVGPKLLALSVAWTVGGKALPASVGLAKERTPCAPQHHPSLAALDRSHLGSLF